MFYDDGGLPNRDHSRPAWAGWVCLTRGIDEVAKRASFIVGFVCGRKDATGVEFDPPEISEERIRHEKEKARRLRKTNWWNARVHKGLCYYCRRRVGRGDLTMDHVVPLSRGGRSTKGNIVPACKECNNRKRYLLPVEWEEYLKGFSGREI